MKRKYNNLPLRIGVGIVVLNKNNQVFLAKRIDNPKNFWQMPQGGVDGGENFYDAAKRELKEETNLNGEVIKLLGTCSYFNSIFGDILLIGMIMDVNNWYELKTGDDAYDATFFKLDKCPKLAFECHQNLFDMYYNNI